MHYQHLLDLICCGVCNWVFTVVFAIAVAVVDSSCVAGADLVERFTTSGVLYNRAFAPTGAVARAMTTLLYKLERWRH